MKCKHIIFFLFIYFIFLFPAMAMTPNVEYIRDVYSNRIEDNYTYYGQLGYITHNGRFLFCLNPYKVIGTDYEIDNNYFNNYDEDTLNYIKMVSNYVDKNLEEKNQYYYMAAQELIWERIAGSDMVYWTAKAKSEGEKINIDEYKNEIASYVNNFLLKPSFDNITVNDNFFSTVVLEDANNVLSNYQVINNSKNKVWISENKLYINILSSKLEQIKLIRKNGDGAAIYYHTDSGQNLAALSSYVENISTIYVKAYNNYNEDINIEFLDKYSGLLVGNVDFKINDDSFNTFDGRYMTNLEKGNYNIEIENVPYGYLLPDNYYFNISESDMDRSKTIKIYLDKPIAVLRVKLDEGLYQLYRKDIYNVSNILISTYDSSTELELSFSKYYVVDLVNHKKYDIDVQYKDQWTKIIYYDLDLSKELLPKNIDDNMKKIDDTSEEQSDDIENEIIADNNQSVNEKKDVNNATKTGQIFQENVGIINNNSNKYTLPNTIDYIKILKSILLTLCVLLMIKHAKEIFKK